MLKYKNFNEESTKWPTFRKLGKRFLVCRNIKVINTWRPIEPGGLPDGGRYTAVDFPDETCLLTHSPPPNTSPENPLYTATLSRALIRGNNTMINKS